MNVSLIAALTRNRGLGFKGDLLYRIPEDLKRFKTLTMGCPIIMGRKTYESIGRPLPGRLNIVVTRNSDVSFDGCTVAHDLESSLSQARFMKPREIFVIGGAQLYGEAMPFATKLYLTLIDAEKEADAFFPEYEHEFTKIVAKEEHETPEGLKYTWIDLERA